MTHSRSNPPSAARATRFAADDEGATTVWMIFWTIVFMMLGGLAVDSAKAWRMEIALQAAADAAAHAAVIALSHDQSDADARDKALAFAEANLPASEYGAVLQSGDVEIGAWDAASGGFSTLGDPDGSKAVRVTLRRTADNGNAENTTFLRLTGLFGWDISVQSVARTVASDPVETSPCWEFGLVARGTFSATSNNLFYGICVHGEAGVSFNNHNTFSTGTEVSMPDLALLSLPGSGYRHNYGLLQALETNSNDPWIVDHVDELIETLRASSGAATVAVGAFDAGSMFSGDAAFVDCGLGGTLSIGQNTVLTGVTLLTNCAIDFKKGVVLIDSVVGTNGDAAGGAGHTVQTPSGLVVGLDDDCADGGGSRLLIDGDFHSAAKMRMNGSQLIASGDVKLAAQASGLDGVSVLSGGNISLTANSGMGTCDRVDFTIPTPSSLSGKAFALAG